MAWMGQMEVTKQVLVNSKMAAKVLSVSDRTVWQLTADGHLPAIRIGRLVRYAMSDLYAFIAARRSGGEAPGIESG